MSLDSRRVVVVGAHWGLVDQTEELLKRAFMQLGFLVETFDFQASRLVAQTSWRRWIPRKIKHALSPRHFSRLAAIDSNLANRDFVRLVDEFQPQLVVCIRAERLSPESIMHAKKVGAFTVNWTGDEPWRFIPEALVPAYDVWAVVDSLWGEWLYRQGEPDGGWRI